MECRKDQENQKRDPQSIVWMVEGPKGDTHRVDRGTASQSKRWIGYTECADSQANAEYS